MEKTPGKAALVSLLYPGLGQLYINKTFHGVMIILGMTSFILLDFTLQKNSNHFTVLLIWGLVAFGTYIEANGLNLESTHNPPVKNICPMCHTKNAPHAEKCSKCGKELRKVLFYYDGVEKTTIHPAIEINYKEIIEYEKRMWTGTITGKCEIYPLREIENVRIKEKATHFFTLSFEYKDSKGRKKQKKITMNIIKLDELRDVLNQRRVSYKP